MEDAAWYGATHANERIALIGATYADARDTMVEGSSGLLKALPFSFIENWNRSLGELVLINGTRYKLFSATEPDRLRGPQHSRAYCDELAAWETPQRSDKRGEYKDTAWDQLLFGLRLGEHPRAVITTTPRPTPLIKRIVADPRTYVTKRPTRDNEANLAPSALVSLYDRYAGTRLGRQELEAEILDEIPGALWTREMIEVACRKRTVPDMQRIVVAVDPSGARGEGDNDADEIGIVVAGKGVDGRGYVLADRSCRLSPAGWSRRVVEAYEEFRADKVVAERNFGGAMVEHTIKMADPRIRFLEVVASRGKVQRAEPVVLLYEQDRVSHSPTHVGELSSLEEQLCQMTSDGYVGEGSPDRADALVWALSELLVTGSTYDSTFSWVS